MAAKKKPDLVAHAFELIAADGWRALTITKLANRAELPVDQVYAQISGKGDLIRQFGDRMDALTFAYNPADMVELTSKERLFELLMRRFDALKAFRPAFLEVQRRRELDCVAVSALGCRLDRLAERLLDACESQLSGPRRRVARRLVMAIYAKVFSVWLKDDTQDLASTMAELDKRLGQLETLSKLSNPFRARQRHQSATDGDEVAA